MSVQIYNRFLAILVLMALAAAVALAFRPVRRAVGDLGLDRSWRWPAFLLAAAATAGSLIFSEVIGYEPCELCWYQRITMYPMVVIFGVDLLGRGSDSRARRYAIPLAVVGLAISVYHYLVQVFPDAGAGVCGMGVPCSARYVEEFGFVSIPFMAGAVFALIVAILLAFGKPVLVGEATDGG